MRRPSHGMTFDVDLRPPTRIQPSREAGSLSEVPAWAREALQRYHETQKGPPHTILGHMRGSKVVEWVLGYLATGFVILEATNVLSGIWGWPVGLERGISLGLGLSVFPISVIAWHHGEKGRQQVTASELLTVGSMVLVIVAAIWRVSA